MENQSQFKLRISRMFRASFGSCRSRNLSDVVEKAVFLPQSHQSFRMIEPLSPKPRPFPSICRPKPCQRPETINQSCIIPAKDLHPRRKVSEPCSPFARTNITDGRTCPPASPISPLNPFYQFGDFKKKTDSERQKNKKKKKTQMKNKHREIFPFSSSCKDINFGGCWYSSEEDEDDDHEREDETDTLFSSKSLSSDSSESRRRRSRKKKSGTRRRRAAATGSSEMGVLPMPGNKVEDSFAVVKCSSDPYNDFRTSMVEMIVEKQIFAAKDLEHLLQCFLSLNSFRHHRVIVEVFTEIWEVLFCNWS